MWGRLHKLFPCFCTILILIFLIYFLFIWGKETLGEEGFIKSIFSFLQIHLESIVVVTYCSDVFIFAPDFVFKNLFLICIFVVAFVHCSVFVFSCSNFSDLVCWSLLLSWVDDATRLLLKHQLAVKYNFRYKYKHCNQLYIHHYLCLSPNLYLYISVLYLQSAGCQSAPKPHNIE